MYLILDTLWQLNIYENVLQVNQINYFYFILLYAARSAVQA